MVKLGDYNAIMLNGGVSQKTYDQLKKEANTKNQAMCMPILFFQRPREKIKLYSIDMMIAYSNIFNPEIEEIELPFDVITQILKKNVWQHSPYDVLMNMNNKAYQQDAMKILYTDLKYPVFFSINNDLEVIDGYHRLAKIYRNEILLKNKKSIKVKYINFKRELLNKFVIYEAETHKQIEKNFKFTNAEMIEQFFKEFCLRPKN